MKKPEGSGEDYDRRENICPYAAAVATRHLWVVVLQYGPIGANTSNFSGKVEFQGRWNIKCWQLSLKIMLCYA